MEQPTLRTTPVQLRVEGMSCGHCEGRVRSALLALAGVATVEVDRDGGRVRVGTEPGTVSSEALAAALTSAGYPARVETAA